MINFFLGDSPQYVFAAVNAEVAAAKKEGRDVIDLGVSNPDIETPDPIKLQLLQAMSKIGSGRYQPSRGIAELRLALCRWYQRHYSVSLDPEQEIVVTHCYILHDLAYADLHFGRHKAHSILEVEGAKDVVAEFFSMSKSYSMAG